MTLQKDILNDKNYKPLLDFGFIGIAYDELNDGTLVPAIMGNDMSISRAARISYGEGTKAISNDEILIRYLLRHHHTTPFEMAEIKFHIKMPIFVARQWIRHRTASVNEYSGRYSIMSNEFYVPEPENIKPQSMDNKQGRTGELSEQNVKPVIQAMNHVSGLARATYLSLINEIPDALGPHDISIGGHGFNKPYYDEDFNGIARELARIVLPVSNYTELYWKANLHNIFHLMKLRMDPHAQYEIRVYAEAMYELLKPYFPIALKAFDDYINEAVTLSKMEYELVRRFFNQTKWESFFPSETFEDKERKRLGMSKREWTEFKSKFRKD